MEVWCIQYIFPTGVHPLFLRELLAHGTAPVAAGIIMDRNAAAFFTYTYVNTKNAGFAVPDVIRYFSLSCRELMCFYIVGIKVVKDILNCTFSTHVSPPLSRS
jgi:hypothetical protein